MDLESQTLSNILQILHFSEINFLDSHFQLADYMDARIEMLKTRISFRLTGTYNVNFQFVDKATTLILSMSQNIFAYE